MAIHLTCPDCLTEMTVVPPRLGQIRAATDPIPTAQPDVIYPGTVRVDTDEDGHFECPNGDCVFASDWDTLVEMNATE